MPFDGKRAIGMMMHAVGHLEAKGRYVTTPPWRNHYCTAEDTGAEIWQALIELGLAEELKFDHPTPQRTFMVTDLGVTFLRARRKALLEKQKDAAHG